MTMKGIAAGMRTQDEELLRGGMPWQLPGHAQAQHAMLLSCSARSRQSCTSSVLYCVTVRLVCLLRCLSSLPPIVLSSIILYPC